MCRMRGRLKTCFWRNFFYTLVPTNRSRFRFPLGFYLNEICNGSFDFHCFYSCLQNVKYRFYHGWLVINISCSISYWKSLVNCTDTQRRYCPSYSLRVLSSLSTQVSYACSYQMCDQELQKCFNETSYISQAQNITGKLWTCRTWNRIAPCGERVIASCRNYTRAILLNSTRVLGIYNFMQAHRASCSKLRCLENLYPCLGISNFSRVLHSWTSRMADQEVVQLCSNLTGAIWCLNGTYQSLNSSSNEAESCATTVRGICGRRGGNRYGSGLIQSPDYPSNYPNNARTTWTLYATTTDQFVKLQFTDFETEKSYDLVTISSSYHVDGTSVRDCDVLRFCRYSGSRPFASSSSWNSKGHQLIVTFSSDSSLTRRGFRAVFQTISAANFFIAPTTKVTRTPSSGNRYGSGLIQSPHYPSNYPNNARTKWTLYATTTDQFVKLQFTYFETERSYDLVTISSSYHVDGTSVMDCDVLRFCRYSGSRPFTSSSSWNSKGHQMIVTFSSDSSSTRRGFRAVFQTISSANFSFAPTTTVPTTPSTCDDDHWGPNCKNPCNCGIHADRCDKASGCICQAGWQGSTCDDNINECNNTQCGQNEKCEDTAGSYRCICVSGYIRNSNASCVEIPSTTQEVTTSHTTLEISSEWPTIDPGQTVTPNNTKDFTSDRTGIESHTTTSESSISTATKDNRVLTTESRSTEPPLPSTKNRVSTTDSPSTEPPLPDILTGGDTVVYKVTVDRQFKKFYDDIMDRRTIRVMRDFEQALHHIFSSLKHYKRTVVKKLRHSSVAIEFQVLFTQALNTAQLGEATNALYQTVQDKKLIVGGIPYHFIGTAFVYLNTSNGPLSLSLNGACTLYDNQEMCLPGGSCIEDREQPKCICSSGFTGKYCEVPQDTFKLLVLSLSVVGAIVFIIFLGVVILLVKQRNVSKDRQLDQWSDSSSSSSGDFSQTRQHLSRLHGQWRPRWYPPSLGMRVPEFQGSYTRGRDNIGVSWKENKLKRTKQQ